MFRYLAACLLLAFTLGVAAQAQVQNSIAVAQPRHSVSVLDSTKEQDGLIGSVRRVRTESAKIEGNSGESAEGPRELIELTTYAVKGNRIENVSYPVADQVLGKQEYKYDERGNITEMTIRDERGSIVTKESYDYEFDGVGNWIKMVTSLVVFENGKLKREPIENTYRTITYYFTDDVAKIVDSPARSIALPAPLEDEVEGPEPTAVKISFPAPVDTDSSSETLKDAPALLRARLVETSTTETKPPTAEPASNAPSNAEPTSASRLMNLKRAPEPASEEKVAVSANNEALAGASPAETTAVISMPAADSPQGLAFSLYEKGLTDLEAGNLKEALGAFLTSVKLVPSAAVYLNLGNVYLKLEKNTEAEKAFQQSVKLGPEVAEAQYGLGLASFRLKHFANARDAFKKATTLEPDMAKAHFGLGLSCLELGQTDDQLIQVRILEKLDKKLAKQLSAASPRLNFSCRFTVCQ